MGRSEREPEREKTREQAGQEFEQRLDLLWGTGERPSRGPKPSLTLDDIARAGIAIADREGLEAVSMRRIAERLGFTTMSLYRYVPGKTELLAVMLDTALGDTLSPSDPTGAWRERLADWARRGRSLFRRHPWLLRVPVPDQLVGPRAIAWTEAGVECLAGVNLSPLEMLETALAVYAYVYGTAHLAREWTQEGSEGWTTDSPLMRRVGSDDRFPRMRALLAAGVFEDPADLGEDDPYGEENFEFGLNRLLDGIEAYIARRPAASGL